MSEQGTIKLELTKAEVEELHRLVDATLGETRVEAHRTHSVDYREKVLGHEHLLRGLLEKLKVHVS